jgi:hypothetical protein
MLTLRGPKLPDNAKLSDYVTDESDNVRITNLRAGQTFDVDMTLDGVGDNPKLPLKAEWYSAVTKREGVHTPMLAIVQSEGFTVQFSEKAEMRDSRGRGITISDSRGFFAHDLWVRGARTAGIAVQKSTGFTLTRPVTIDTGNYQSAKGQGKNWPGSIKMENCSAYRVIEPASLDHMGNGLTPTESSGGEWIEPFAYAVHGAMIYINASPGQIVDGGFAIGGTPTNRPSAYVLNSEEENEGSSDGARFEGCNSLDVSWGFAIWGNEKKPNVVIQRAAMIDGVLISDNGSKIHPNAVVLNYDDTGTLLIKPEDLPANVLANLRSLADRLAAAYRAHADAADITLARVALGAAFAALRGPVVVPDPVIDRAALVALLGEGEAIAEQQRGWLARLGALVG